MSVERPLFFGMIGMLYNLLRVKDKSIPQIHQKYGWYIYIYKPLPNGWSMMKCSPTWYFLCWSMFGENINRHSLWLWFEISFFFTALSVGFHVHFPIFQITWQRLTFAKKNHDQLYLRPWPPQSGGTQRANLSQFLRGVSEAFMYMHFRYIHTYTYVYVYIYICMYIHHMTNI